MALAFGHPMPAKRIAAPKDSSSTANLAFEPMAKGEAGSANVEVENSRPFVIRNSSFGNWPVPVCLWFLTKNKAADAKRDFRDRRKDTLFIDARKLGTFVDRVHGKLKNVAGRTGGGLNRDMFEVHSSRMSTMGTSKHPHYPVMHTSSQFGTN